MSRTERLYKIQSLLVHRGALTAEQLQAELEVSRATLMRDMSFQRDRLGAPIAWSRDTGCYHWVKSASSEREARELPGLWFTPAEVHAMLILHHLVDGVDQSAFMTGHIAPLERRLQKLLQNASQPADAAGQLQRRVRIIGLAQRGVRPKHFEVVGAALVRRQRLRIGYHARGSDTTAEREISPLRLIHYRSNWYLDAWCHWRQALRSFSLDAMEQVQMLEHSAIDLSDAELDRQLGSGYGIFSGEQVQWATLRFSAERARWVKAEQWHPEQQGQTLPDGRFELRIPYSDPRELLMDILKHGAHCEVLAPASLRQTAVDEVQRMREKYFQKP